MKMPGFTAEASLYQTSECYHLGRTKKAMNCGKEVLPQISVDMMRRILCILYPWRCEDYLLLATI